MKKTDTGDREDIKVLDRALRSESDSNRRDNIRRTIRKIKNRPRIVKSMRESLVRAHRNKDKAEIKDIHDYISKRSKYGQDKPIERI